MSLYSNPRGVVLGDLRVVLVNQHKKERGRTMTKKIRLFVSFCASAFSMLVLQSVLVRYMSAERLLHHTVRAGRALTFNFYSWLEGDRLDCLNLKEDETPPQEAFPAGSIVFGDRMIVFALSPGNTESQIVFLEVEEFFSGTLFLRILEKSTAGVKGRALRKLFSLLCGKGIVRRMVSVGGHNILVGGLIVKLANKGDANTLTQLAKAA